MSDQDNIFNSAPGGAESADSPKAPEDLLASIRNEAGEQKYADVETALKALEASQRYIPEVHSKLDTVAAENQRLREELAAQKAVADIVDRIAPPEPDTSRTPAAEGLDAEKAAELFEQMLSKREQAVAREKNIKAVTKALTDKYGDKSEAMFYSKGEELGMSPQELNSLASTSPAAVLALFGTRADGTAADVSVKSSVYVDPEPKPLDTSLGPNKGRSVLMGATSADVRAEYEIVKDLVARMHEEGGSAEDLSDPQMYKKFFRQRTD